MDEDYQIRDEAAVPERQESLWLLTLGPSIWAAHFLLCYLTAAIACAKWSGLDGTLTGVRVTIAIYTLIAMLGILWVGWVGIRRHLRGGEAAPHEEDTAGDRHRFLGFATVLLAGLSAVATLFTAFPAVFISSCA